MYYYAICKKNKEFLWCIRHRFWIELMRFYIQTYTSWWHYNRHKRWQRTETQWPRTSNQAHHLSGYLNRKSDFPHVLSNRSCNSGSPWRTSSVYCRITVPWSALPYPCPRGLLTLNLLLNDLYLKSPFVSEFTLDLWSEFKYEFCWITKWGLAMWDRSWKRRVSFYTENNVIVVSSKVMSVTLVSHLLFFSLLCLYIYKYI